MGASLAISRHLQDATGASIKKIVQTLRTIRYATTEVNGQQLTLEPKFPSTPRTFWTRSKVTKPGE